MLQRASTATRPWISRFRPLDSHLRLASGLHEGWKRENTYATSGGIWGISAYIPSCSGAILSLARLPNWESCDEAVHRL